MSIGTTPTHQNVQAATKINGICNFSNREYNRLVGLDGIARVYGFEPVQAALDEREKQNIIGTQGCIWTEWVKDGEKLEWQMMPRIAALCETQWTQADKKDLDGFLGRLAHLLDIYRLRGYNFRNPAQESVGE